MRRLLLAAALFGWPLLPALADATQFTVAGPGQSARPVTDADLAALPPRRQHVVFQTGHGAQAGDYAGVSLWDLLTRLGDLPAGPPKTHVKLVIYVTGQDGYVAALAEGEIDPAFEGKAVLLARDVAPGAAAEAGWRLVVPGDRHGARDVQDVAKVELR